MLATVLKYENSERLDQPVKRLIIGMLLGFLIVPFGAYLYFASGRAPVATTDSDMPFEGFFAHKALDARIAREMPKDVPVKPTEGNYLDGADLYKRHCAVCHGVPLTAKSSIAAGMYPRPPQLFEGKGVTDDEPGETYWKIFNGIRMTGMPGFSKSLSENQMWQIAILLANADKLPPSVKAALVAPIAASAPAATVPLMSPVPPAPAFPNSAPK
jgi:thiosulfate dehydrogenase